MNATIATHNSSKVKREHNKRDGSFIKNELEKEFREKGTRHIRTDGEYEIWLDVDARKFYVDTFQKSVDEYNERQKRDDRKIIDYYQKICDDEKKHAVYEMISGVYGSDVPPELCKKINREFFDGWNERNPNLPLIGAYWHNDEGNLQCGHCHLDYVPVAYNCKTGPKTGTSLNQALKQMGFVDKGKQTAQMQWQNRENNAFAEICQKYGISIIRPKEKQRHKEKEVYILEQREKEASERLSEASERLSEAERVQREKITHIEQLNAEIAAKTFQRDELMESLNQTADNIRRLNDEVQKTIQSTKKQPIERLASNPPKTNFLGQEKQPATTLVRTSDLDALEQSPGLTPSVGWKLNDIENGIRDVSSMIDSTKEQRLSSRIQELEGQLIQERQINRKLSLQIQRLKDWTLDIVEKELSIFPNAQNFVRSITSKIREKIDSIDRTSIDLTQNHEKHFSF